MRAYSLDLRERVVAAYEKGDKTIVEIAAQFSVGQTFLKKMLRQKRQSGSLERLPGRAGAKKVLSAEHRSFLARHIKKHPDATLAELQECLQARRGVLVSRATLSRELQLLRLPRKKNLLSPESAIRENERGFGDG
jgi:transposase